MTSESLLSVIVPVQEHDCLGDTLQALATQQGVRPAGFEVIAVDSLYQHDWSAIVARLHQQYPELQLDFSQIAPTRSRARQLNHCIRRARGDLLLLLADDFIPSPGLVRAHLDVHRQYPSEQVVGIGPGLFPDTEETTEFMHWLEDSGAIFGVRFKDPELVLPEHYFYMANTSIKRNFLHTAGVFNEVFPYDAMDDLEMGLRLVRLGLRSVLVPGAIATHQHLISFQERCLSMHRAGESAALYELRTGGRLLPAGVRGKSPPRRRKESREQRYARVLQRHFVNGYRQTLQAG